MFTFEHTTIHPTIIDHPTQINFQILNKIHRNPWIEAIPIFTSFYWPQQTRPCLISTLPQNTYFPSFPSIIFTISKLAQCEFDHLEDLSYPV